jgi:hypothetical protein
MDESTNSPMTDDLLTAVPSDEDLERAASAAGVDAAMSLPGAPTVSILVNCCSNNGS